MTTGPGPLVIGAVIVVVGLVGAGLMSRRGTFRVRRLPVGIRVTTQGLPKLDEEYLDLLLRAVLAEWERRHGPVTERTLRAWRA